MIEALEFGRLEGQSTLFLSCPQRRATFVIHDAFQVRGESPVTRASAWRVPERAAARAQCEVTREIRGGLPPMPESSETDHLSQHAHSPQKCAAPT